MADVCVVGDLVTDVIVRAHAPTVRGADIAADIDIVRGGSGANVAMALSAAGTATRFVGVVGNDVRGDGLLAVMRLAGVDLDVTRSGASGTVVALVDADGERSFLSDRRHAPHRATIAPAVLDGVRWLHVSGYSVVEGAMADAVGVLLGEAIERGIERSISTPTTTVLEHFGVERFQSLIEHSAPRLLIANDEEAALLTDGGPMVGADFTIVTAGADPTEVRAPGAPTVEVMAPSTTVVDTTGAGDAFAAGLIDALLRGGPIVDCVRRGHHLAAQAATTVGPMQRSNSVPAPKAAS